MSAWACGYAELAHQDVRYVGGPHARKVYRDDGATVRLTKITIGNNAGNAMQAIKKASRKGPLAPKRRLRATIGLEELNCGKKTREPMDI